MTNAWASGHVSNLTLLSALTELSDSIVLSLLPITHAAPYPFAGGALRGSVPRPVKSDDWDNTLVVTPDPFAPELRDRKVEGVDPNRVTIPFD